MELELFGVMLAIVHFRPYLFHRKFIPAERAIGALVRLLRALCQEADGGNGENWDELLPVALMALRAHIHDTLGVSPYELLHGIPMRLPLDERMNVEPGTRLTPLHGLATRLQRLRERVARYEEKQRARYKDVYDRGRKKVVFRVGEEVLLHFPSTSPQQSRKLGLHWRGPYRILREIANSPNIFVVGDDNNKEVQVVNVRRLRKFHRLPLHLTPTPHDQREATSTSAADSAISGQIGTESKSDGPEDLQQQETSNASDQEERWEVDCLMNKRKRQGRTYYLVKWAGVDPETHEPYDPSWEPEEHIAKDLIDDYERLSAGFRRR